MQVFLKLMYLQMYLRRATLYFLKSTDLAEKSTISYSEESM